VTDDYAAVLELLTRVPRPPEAPPPAGATEEQLDALDSALGYPTPDAVRGWLRACNGIIAGPGGLYGTQTALDFLDIESVLARYPQWQSAGWLPVAGDGTGNQYVVDTRREHLGTDAVFFVDVSADPDRLGYVVASGLRRFLLFLLEKEVGERRWPFDSGYTLDQDPDLAEVTPPELLPWHAG
jgi:cell wall assembly regulator SMI1